jgi:hypothetical protein
VDLGGIQEVRGFVRGGMTLGSLVLVLSKQKLYGPAAVELPLATRRVVHAACFLMICLYVFFQTYSLGQKKRIQIWFV